MNRCIIVDSLLRTSADRLSQAFASVHGGTATSVEGMRVIPIKMDMLPMLSVKKTKNL